MLGTLEHHVFKKMREAAAPARFQTKADVVVDAQRCHRRGAVGRNNDAQSVVEFGAFQRNVQLVQFRSFIYAAASHAGKIPLGGCAI